MSALRKSRIADALRRVAEGVVREVSQRGANQVVSPNRLARLLSSLVAVVALAFAGSAQAQVQTDGLCASELELSANRCADVPVELSEKSLPVEAGSEERAEAPMCDPSAASVVAMPFVPDAQGGSVEELPCDGWGLSLSMNEPAEKGVFRSGGLPVPSEPSADSSLWVVLPLSLNMPRLVASLGGLGSTAISAFPQAEHRRRIDRPPLGVLRSHCA